MGPSDSRISVIRALRLSLALGLLRDGRLFLAARACAHGHAKRRRVVTGSPSHRSFLAERCGPPRCLGRPLRACRGQRPRRVRSCPRPSQARRHGLQEYQRLGHPELMHFVAIPTRPTRSRAYASAVSLPWPPQGSLPTWWGFTLVGRDSHPLDDKLNFRDSSHHPSFQTSLAWSHWYLQYHFVRFRLIFFPSGIPFVCFERLTKGTLTHSEYPRKCKTSDASPAKPGDLPKD